MISEKIYIEKVTSEELAEIKNDSFENFINTLESNNPDSSYFFDLSLSALLDYLYETGYNDSDIIMLNNNYYGDFVKFYYIKDYDMYVMEIGIY